MGVSRCRKGCRKGVDGQLETEQGRGIRPFEGFDRVEAEFASELEQVPRVLQRHLEPVLRE